MTVTLNPKLLDVVKFTRSGGSELVPVRGTIVELLGSDTALVEVSDETGIAKDLVPVPIPELEVVWSSHETHSQEIETGDEAQQYFQEGLLLLQNGVPGAVEKFKKAFSLQPNLAGILMNLTNDLATKGDFDPALFLYGLIVELQPEYRLARENLAITRLNRGVEFARVGALDKAIEDFTGALSLGSDEIAGLCRNNLAATHTQLGLHHVHIKRFSEAFHFFLVALHLNPSPTTRRNFALALVSLLAWNQETPASTPSTMLFREPMLIGLTYSECLNAYGATVASLGKTLEAREIIEGALEADPSNQLAKRNLGVLLQEDRHDIVPPEMWGLTSAEPKTAELSVQ